ncbi:hypothetical protein ACP4OV_026642 [Aristida adscensionis]
MPAERVRGLASDNNGAGAKIGDRGHFAGGNRCLGAWRTHRPQRRLISQPLPPATILAYSMVCGVDQRLIQINSSGLKFMRAVQSIFGCSKKMQRAMQAIGSHGSVLKSAVLRHVSAPKPAMLPAAFSRFLSASPASLEERGFETATVSDVLKSKGKGADGSWLWCTTEDSVYDAVKSMTQHNVGALMVVKPGQDKSIAGIVTERDYLRKIIVQGRSSKSTKVGDIMTEENKLITVKPDTRVLQAMQLMTENRIRHIPVIDGTGMLGMVSIGDVVRAVVTEHREELNRLNAYIQGGY